MKSIFEKVIARGGYDLNGILKRIDEYHIEGKLTDDERVHLIAAARGDATPDVDAASEVQRLWAALREVTERVAKLEGNASDDDDTDADNIAEYRKPTGAHDAYYTGDVVTFNGKVYECIAPAAAACVWSPDEMPGYWEARS